MYAESHGIIDNNMYDFDLKERFCLSCDSKFNDAWWGGEPASILILIKVLLKVQKRVVCCNTRIIFLSLWITDGVEKLDSVTMIFTPHVPVFFFWPGRHNFGDINLKFWGFLSTSVPLMKNCGLKNENFIYLNFI